MIKEFRCIFRDPLYDRANNLDQRSVQELSPIGCAWKFGTTIFEHSLHGFGSCCLFSSTDNRHEYIAVVDIFDNNGISYILSKDNIVLKKLPNESKNGEAIKYFDVYLSKYEEAVRPCIFSQINDSQMMTILDQNTLNIMDNVRIEY